MEFIKQRKILIILGILLIFIIIYTISNKNKKNDYNILTEDFTTENLVYVEQENNEIILHISGAVKKKGIVKLKQGDRISDAIEKADGIADDADLSKINLAYKVKDGQKIYIPSINDEEDIEYITDNAGVNTVKENTDGQKININEATQEQLETLPGIGEATAIKIIDYRKKNGKFQKIDDIMNVSGIGESKFNNIKDKIET